MKVAILGLLVCALALASAAPEQSKKDTISLSFPKDKLHAFILKNYIAKHSDSRVDCSNCIADIVAAFDDCAHFGDSFGEIFNCIMDIVGTIGDCGSCICVVLDFLC